MHNQRHTEHQQHVPQPQRKRSIFKPCSFARASSPPANSSSEACQNWPHCSCRPKDPVHHSADNSLQKREKFRLTADHGHGGRSSASPQPPSQSSSSSSSVSSSSSSRAYLDGDLPEYSPSSRTSFDSDSAPPKVFLYQPPAMPPRPPAEQQEVDRKTPPVVNLVSITAAVAQTAAASEGGGRMSEDNESKGSSNDHHQMLSGYLVPFKEEDKDRLNVFNEITKYAFSGLLVHSPQGDLFRTKRTRVLDVGCGPGWWMRDFALSFPLADVVGVDHLSDYFDQVKMPPNCTFVEADVEGILPFADNTFDFCIQRSMIGYISSDSFTKLLQELKRVTRPGGYIELVEGYYWLTRRGPAGRRHERLMTPQLASRGVDFKIAHKLDVLLSDAGLVDIDEDMKSVPVGWGGNIGSYTDYAFRETLRHFKDYIMEAAQISTAADFEHYLITIMDECVVFKSYWNWYWACGRVLK
ncbi:S-adenosyl-L-methionine-dependent methyltransferase [Zopfochytrium polystomum]|nr:S-adenosyl-L-methionine-dependent methyltransferase [Zopfochytrium polystomum]